MNWMNELGGILQQYTGAGAGAAPAPEDIHDHFDQTAQAAPPETLADGLSAAFRSDETPEFGQMVASLFGQSNGQQRAGILNTLISAVGPSVAARLFAGKGLSGLAGLLGGGQTQITAEQAEQVSPEVAQEIAAHAEKHDPSIIDTVSNFYAEHPTLIKSLGSAALAITLAKIASSYR